MNIFIKIIVSILRVVPIELMLLGALIPGIISPVFTAACVYFFGLAWGICCGIVFAAGTQAAFMFLLERFAATLTLHDKEYVVFGEIHAPPSLLSGAKTLAPLNEIPDAPSDQQRCAHCGHLPASHHFSGPCDVSGCICLHWR